MKIDDALEREIEAVMEDKAVTNVSGWTIPNTDSKCDEAAYRERLEKNASILFEKFDKALRFD